MASCRRDHAFTDWRHACMLILAFSFHSQSADGTSAQGDACPAFWQSPYNSSQFLPNIERSQVIDYAHNLVFMHHGTEICCGFWRSDLSFCSRLLGNTACHTDIKVSGKCKSVEMHAFYVCPLSWFSYVLSRSHPLSLSLARALSLQSLIALARETHLYLLRSLPIGAEGSAHSRQLNTTGVAAHPHTRTPTHTHTQETLIANICAALANMPAHARQVTILISLLASQLIIASDYIADFLRIELTFWEYLPVCARRRVPPRGTQVWPFLTFSGFRWGEIYTWNSTRPQCVCIYLCITHILTYIYMYTYIYIYMYRVQWECTQPRMWQRPHSICIYIYIYIYIILHIYTIYIYIYLYVYIYLYM